jgi:predicted component of type VI protein secretion system
MGKWVNDVETLNDLRKILTDIHNEMVRYEAADDTVESVVAKAAEGLKIIDWYFDPKNG